MEISRYEPKGAARDLFTCRDTEILIEGAAGTGKTRGVLEKIFACMVKYRGARSLILRKTRASMTESVLVTLEQKVIPDNPQLYPLLAGQQRRNRQSYDFPNGSSIVCGGMDNPDRIMSSEYDMIGVFEGTELLEREFEPLLTRLRNGRMPYQQAIVDVNPGATMHWLNRRASSGRMHRMLSRHEDNPSLYSGGEWTESGVKYLAVLDRLSGVRHTRLRLGRWATAEGVVYPDFDPLTHVVALPVIANNWRRIRVIDFGYTNPFVCLWIAIDPDGRMYVYRELYGTQRLVEDWAREIVRLSEGEHIEATIADHDAEDRATLQRHGIDTAPAVKAVTVGIQNVEQRLRKSGDGRPRIFVVQDSLVTRDQKLADAHRPVSIVEEFEAYVWPKDVNGRPQKEEPVKENDHGLDALRYGAAYVDGIMTPAASVRILGGAAEVRVLGKNPNVWA